MSHIHIFFFSLLFALTSQAQAVELGKLGVKELKDLQPTKCTAENYSKNPQMRIFVADSLIKPGLARGFWVMQVCPL